jgi:polyphosphate kinase
VISIVDRFLEHARVFYFENGGAPEYFLASADWMPRNLDHRVEIGFPVLEPALQRSVRAILDTQLADTEKVREIGADGRSKRRTPSAAVVRVRSQELFYAMLRAPARGEHETELEAPHKNGQSAQASMAGAASV